MPFINGRYYANPIFGEAVERARNGKSGDEFNDEVSRQGAYSGSEFDESLPSDNADDDAGEPEFQLESARRPASAKQHATHKKAQAAKAVPPEQDANRVYNETSGLRPTAKLGAGSAQDLHSARFYIAHVLGNREATGRIGIVAPRTLRPGEAHAIHAYRPAMEAYGDSLSAAQKAASTPDPTGGATNYYLDYGQDPPSWAVDKKPVAVFGPFLDASGSGGVHNPKKGDKVHIRVYHLTH